MEAICFFCESVIMGILRSEEILSSMPNGKLEAVLAEFEQKKSAHLRDKISPRWAWHLAGNFQFYNDIADQCIQPNNFHILGAVSPILHGERIC